MWKYLGNDQGHGFGYCQYWHYEDIAHPEHPEEIPEELNHGQDGVVFVSTIWADNKIAYDIYNFTDDKYLYVIHVHEETFNYFRYSKGDK